MQTLFAECPKGRRLSYSLEIPISGFSPAEFEVWVQEPGGQAKQQSVKDELLRISRSDPPGVWRFTALVRSCKDQNDVADTITAEVVVFPQTEEAVQTAVAQAVGAVGVSIQDDRISVSGKGLDVSEEWTKLWRSFGDSACLELLRRLGLGPGDATEVLRSLVLLQPGLARSAARGLLPFAMPVLSELASGAAPAIIRTRILPLLKEAQLPPQDKWIYLMRVVTEVNASCLGEAIDLLRELTPMQYRESAADLVMEVSTSGSEAALRLFAQFGYAPAAPMVLEWLRSARATPLFACSLLRAADYRESIPVLRSLLPNLTWGNTDFAIIKLLADWGDAESVPLLLRKLAAAHAGSETDSLVQLILDFGSDFRKNIEETAKKCSPEKAKQISAVLSAR
jgi:hypothetical protein